MGAILVVCTGNQRRSPALEAMLRHGIGGLTGLDEAGISVSSAGTGARNGALVDPVIATEVARSGISLGSHITSHLTAQQIQDADLVLTAERVHRSEVVRLVPAAVRYTFTAVEFAALGARVDAAALAGTRGTERLQRLVQLAPQERAGRVIRDGSVDDLADVKHVNPKAAARLVADLTAPAEVILRLLESDASVSVLEVERGRGSGEPPSLSLPLG